MAVLRPVKRILAAIFWLPSLLISNFAKACWTLLALIAGGITYACLFAAVTVGAGFFLVDTIENTLPEPKPISRFSTTRTTQVFDPSGAESFRVANEYRLFEPIHTMPEILISAFIAAEDQRFYEHSGLDGESFARAMVQNVRRVMTDKRLLGGSTITQQVAKISMGADRTMARKLREAIYATKLERSLTKDQILEIYLNKIYFGVNTYGVGAAAERYFGKSVQQLNLSEVAYLAALPKGPVNYHPTRRPEAAKARRDWVVSRMLELDMISQVEAEVAVSRALNKELFYGLRSAARGHFNKEVKRELGQRFGQNAIGTQGFEVVSTFEPETQKFAELTLSRHLLELDALMGFRGPLTRVDMTDPAWDQRFLSVENPSDFENWQTALVLEVRNHRAGIVLDNGRMGRLTLQDVKWARKYSNGEKIYPLPWRVSDVVSVGDIILVEPLSGATASPIFDETTPDLNRMAQRLRNRVAEKRSDLPTAPRYRLRQNPELNGSVVILDAKSSQVKAMVGGYSSTQSAFNRATQAQRQPGSTIKPFIALTALENGYRGWSKLKDEEMTLTLKGGEIWTPKNAGGGFWGEMSLEQAIVHSKNVPLVNLYYQLGHEKLNETFEGMNLYDEYINTPSVVLGANETSLLRLTAAYGALANDGTYREPTTIASVRDPHGELLYASNNDLTVDCLATAFCHRNEESSVASFKAVQRLKTILRKGMEEGTGKNVNKLLSETVYGKTGTTNGSRDAWFVGFTDDLVVGVFVGYDNPRSLGENATGSRVAGPIFADLMNGIRKLENGDETSAAQLASYSTSQAFDRARNGRAWYFQRSGGVEVAEPQDLAGNPNGAVSNGFVPGFGNTLNANQPSALDTPSLDWGMPSSTTSGATMGETGNGSVAIY